jgi:hypothetical protein
MPLRQNERHRVGRMGWLRPAVGIIVVIHLVSAELLKPLAVRFRH